MSGFDEYLKKKRQEEEQNPPQARQSGFQAYLAERQAGDSLYDQWLAGEQRRQQSALAANQYYTSRNQQQYQARQAQQAQQRVQPGGDLYDYYKRTQKQNTPAPAMTGREISGAMRSMETARRAIENPDADNGINASLSSNWLREAARQEASRLPRMDVSGGLESLRDRIKALDADPMHDNGVNASVMGAAMQESAQLKAYRDTILEEAEAEWRRAEQAVDIYADAETNTAQNERAREAKGVWQHLYAAMYGGDPEEAWKEYQDADRRASEHMPITDEQAMQWYAEGIYDSPRGNMDTYEADHQALMEDADRKRAIYEGLVNYEGSRRVGEAEAARAQAERTYQEAYAALTDAEIRGDEEGIKRAREVAERAEAARKASSKLYETAYKETYGANRNGGKAVLDRIKAGAIDFAAQFFQAPQTLLSWLPDGELKRAINATGNTFTAASDRFREVTAESTKAMGDNPWWERGLNMVEEGTRQTLNFLTAAIIGKGGVSAGHGEAATAAWHQRKLLNALGEAAKFYYTNPEYWSVFLTEAGNGYRENLKRGMSDARAAVLSLLNASLNAKIEFGIPGLDTGGVQSLYHKSGGRWDDVFQGALDLLDSGFGEGGEELAQGVTEGLVLKLGWNNGEDLGSENGMKWLSAKEGEDAVFNVKDLGEAALAGGLMGFTGGAPRMGLEMIANSGRNSQYWQQVQDAASKYVTQYGDEGLQEMIRQGVQIAPESSTYHQAAVDLSQRLDEATDVEKARFIGYAQEWAEQADEQERQTQDRLGHVATDDETMRGYVEAAADAVMPEQRNAFVSTWNMSQTDNVEGFATEFKRLYNQGTTAQNMDDALASVKTMTREQAVRAYGIGLAEHQAQQATAQRGARTAGQLSITQNGQTQTYTDATMRTSSFYKALNQQQKTAVDIGTAYSAALGVNVNFFQTEDLSDPIQGYYDAGTSTISINLNAGLESEADTTDNSKYIGARILGHEITHFAEQWAPAEYDAFRSSVFSVLKARGVDVDALIDEQMARAEAARARGVNVTMSYDDATREVIADSMTDILRDSTLAQQMAQENPGLFKRIAKKIKELVAKIRKYFAELSPNTYEGATALQEEVDGQLRYLGDIVKQWEAMERKAGENLRAAVANPASESIGIQIDTNTESAAPSQFSLRTWTHSEYVKRRRQAIDELASTLNLPKKQVAAYIDSINSVAKLIADDQMRLDYDANDIFTMVKPDQEYKFTIDASTLCAKRRYFTGTMDAIQELLPDAILTAEDRVQIRSMMQAKKYEVACGFCYVESSRKDSGPKAQRFIDAYRRSQETGESLKYESTSGKVHEVRVNKNPVYAGEYIPNQNDLNSTRGIDALQKNHPEVYDAYVAYMNRMGQSKPKLLETRTEYRGEIAKFRQSLIDHLNSHGGLRLQSYSDFETPHMIDMMQVVLDMSKVGLKSQAYTKIPNFARVFGRSGVKINLSLVAKGTGVDSDGNLMFDDVEGMPHDEAFAIREGMPHDEVAIRDMYSKNVGTILVGKNDAHIIAAMADPRIDFIIPFHKSQWNMSLYDALGLTGYDDYTSYQNEKGMDGSKVENYDPSEYWDPTKSGDENAQIYLEKCRNEGRIPKFPQFASYPGYWKLLIDFKMYDNDGNFSPQEVVRPDFNMDEANRILNEYEEGHRSFPVAQDVVDQFVADYRATHDDTAEHDGNVQYSLRINPQMEREYQAAAKNGDERKASALVKEAAAAAGYTVEGYHGTQQFGFTRIDTGKSDDSASFFVTTDAATAGSYAGGNQGVRNVSRAGVGARDESDALRAASQEAGSLLAEAMSRINGGKQVNAEQVNQHIMSRLNSKVTTSLKSITRDIEYAVEDEVYALADDLFGRSLHGPEFNQWIHSDDSGQIHQLMEDTVQAYTRLAEHMYGEGQGIYHVYINPSNLLTIDGNGKPWNRIDGSGTLPATNQGKLWTTRTISAWAKSHGYDGVLFRAIRDSGGKGSQVIDTAVDVYSLFSPQEQVKSADPFTYDENGNLISLADRFNPQNPDIRYSLRQTQTPEFKNWFGDWENDPQNASKIVDEDGRPLVVYHGTSENFTVFDPSKGRTNMDIQGMFFSPWELDAQGYGENVGAYYLNIRNPAPESVAYRALNRFKGQNNAGVKARDYLIRLGYDGVNNSDEEYIAFRPEQIKSATDNVGTFDTQNPDIRYSLARPTLSNRDLLRQVAVDLNGIAEEAGFTENQVAAVQSVVDDIDALNNASSMLREATAQLRSASADWNHRIEDAKKARAASRPMSSQEWKAADAVVKELEACKEAAMADLRSIWEMRSAEVSRFQAAVARAESGQTAQFVLRKARDLAMRNMRRAEHEAVTAYRMQRDERTAAAINRKYIQREARDLREWMLKPDRKNYMKHVPLPFQEALVGFLESIDESSERKLKGGEPTKADLRMVQNMNKLRRVIAGKDPDTNDPVFFDLPVGFADQLSDQMEQIQMAISMSTSEEGYVLNRMNSDQLKALREIIKILKRSIKNFNAFYNQSLYAHVYEAAEDTMQTLGQIPKRTPSKLDRIDNYLNWQSMRPAYAFERFGQGGKAVWNSIKQGQDKLAFLAKEIIDFSQETFTEAEARAWNDEVITIDLPSGGSVRMTPAQIMSLYELNKRDQARLHLYGGGFRPTNVETSSGMVSNDNHEVTEGDVNAIISKLTDRQREVADKLQQFMSTRGSELGNEVSQRRFLLNQFTDEHYFPINSDGRNIAITEATEKMSGSTLFALINSSFTQDPNPNANNPLAVYPIFEVFSNHMADIAQYNAFALPVIDALKWLNYREMNDEGKYTNRGVRQAMIDAYGFKEGGAGYAVDFVNGILKALNGTETQGDKYDSDLQQALHYFNATRVAFNGRVVVQQPLAFARAALLMNPRDMVTAIKPARIRSNIEEMRQYSGVALWKSMGFYDVNISQNLSDMIGQKSDWRQRMTEVGLMGAEYGDTITWATIWEAAKNQARRENYTGDNLLPRAAEIFDEVVYKTQVVDSVLTKSEYMRQKKLANRLFSSFMAEPVTTASMLLDAKFKFDMDVRKNGLSAAWKNNRGNIVRTALVFALTAVLNASITAVYDAWRDDDDYETFWEKVFEHFRSNVGDELNVLHLLPLVSDMSELVEYGFQKLIGNKDAYYNPTSLMPQSLDTLITGVTKTYDKIKKTLDGETSNYSWYYGISKLVDAVSGLFGIPAYPIVRELKDLWNNTVGRFVPSAKVLSYDPGKKTRVREAFEEGFLTAEEAQEELTQNPEVLSSGEMLTADDAYWLVRGWETGGESKYAALDAAITAGDDHSEALQVLIEHGTTDQAIKSHITTAIKNAFLDGGLTEEEAVYRLIRYRGHDEKEAKKIVAKWK